MKSEVLHFPSVKTGEHLKAWVVGLIATWFLMALGCSLLGVFDSQPPIALGAAVVLPVVAFALCYRGFAAFRDFVLRVNLRSLALAQTWRVGGLLFVVLYWQGILPGVFALSAGWGDFAVGATAPLIAWLVASRKTSFPKKTFVVWNVLGLLDLGIAVALGLLASGGPSGVLAGEVTTAVMGQFPLSLIPTFFVPLLAILHLISLARVRYAMRFGSSTLS